MNPGILPTDYTEFLEKREGLTLSEITELGLMVNKIDHVELRLPDFILSYDEVIELLTPKVKYFLIFDN